MIQTNKLKVKTDKQEIHELEIIFLLLPHLPSHIKLSKKI